MPSTVCNVVVLISGSGSNLQALIDQSVLPQSHYKIAAVISNRPNVRGLQRAEAAGINAHLIDHTEFADREQFDRALLQQIDDYQPNLVVLAGFMRILTPGFVSHYSGRLLNIHPSLLPKYPGLHTHQRALDAGDAFHGSTVHFATEELDGGPPILQAKVAVQSEDDADSLAARVLQQEHRIYPTVVGWYAQGRLTLKDSRAWLDGELIPATGIAFEE